MWHDKGFLQGISIDDLSFFLYIVYHIPRIPPYPGLHNAPTPVLSSTFVRQSRLAGREWRNLRWNIPSYPHRISLILLYDHLDPLRIFRKNRIRPA